MCIYNTQARANNGDCNIKCIGTNCSVGELDFNLCFTVGSLTETEQKEYEALFAKNCHISSNMKLCPNPQCRSFVHKTVKQLRYGMIYHIFAADLINYMLFIHSF